MQEENYHSNFRNLPFTSNTAVTPSDFAHPRSQYSISLYLYGIPALAGKVLYFVLVKDKPALPPNAIAGEKKVSMTVGLKAFFKNRDFLFLLGLFLIGAGSFNAILTEIDYIFKDRPLDIDSALAAGIVGGQIGGLPIVFFFNMTAITVLFGVAFVLALLLQDIKAPTLN